MHGSHSSSPVLIKKARIEIIPLIDIMFFLLASFMLVSLTMINMKAIEVNLPTAATAQPNTKPDFIIVSVDALGDFYFEKDKVPKEEVLSHFQQLYSQNHDVRIYIRADKQAVYEGVMYVLDQARNAGIQKVGLEIKAQDAVQGGPPTGGAPPAGGTH
ncbi:MAG: biopolymer transporter ExbD [Verrucomicrobia bacterium]|jgi:biopolymer transport protein ExbD|nr:biopolymer transporter ExbD [Verrucomicrobiota bacterium]